MDKVFYNQASEKKLGWEPYWFGASQNDEDCVDAIAAWQTENGITADGMCGPSTYRRIWTDRERDISSNVIHHIGPHNGDHPDASRLIVHNGHFYPIDWNVVLWDNPSALVANYGTFYDYSGKEDRKPTFFVNHWDVCLSSTQCQKVLDKRGISVHFLIDNDGTIYQTLDLQHAAFHAGNVNRKSVGVEISNAYYPKYQSTYVRNGFGERPLVEGARVHHSELDPFLDFYPVQIEALKALWASIHAAADVPYETPLNQFGKTSTIYEQQWAYGKERGFVSHYHVNKKKIDCAGLDIKTLLEDLDD